MICRFDKHVNGTCRKSSNLSTQGWVLVQIHWYYIHDKIVNPLSMASEGIWHSSISGPQDGRNLNLKPRAHAFPRHPR